MSGTDGISSLQKALGSLSLTETKQATTVEKTLAGRTPACLSAQTYDQASVSGAGGLAAQATDVRLDKVASLRQQIAAGTYSVPASDVADKLVESLLSN